MKLTQQERLTIDAYDHNAKVLKHNGYEILESYEGEHTDKQWLAFFAKTR